jgi:hypothetical protein
VRALSCIFHAKQEHDLVDPDNVDVDAGNPSVSVAPWSPGAHTEMRGHGWSDGQKTDLSLETHQRLTGRAVVAQLTDSSAGFV